MGINQLTSVSGSGSGSGSGSSWGSFGMAARKQVAINCCANKTRTHAHTPAQTHTHTPAHTTKANILFGFANYSICIVFLMYFIIHFEVRPHKKFQNKQTKQNSKKCFKIHRQ